MAFLVPAVERAHHKNFFGVRSPYGEIRSLSAVLPARMRAKALVQLDVAAFVKEIEIVIGEQRHWRGPWQGRTFFGFVRLLDGLVGASSGALCLLLGHFGDESPPRGLRY